MEKEKSYQPTPEDLKEAEKVMSNEQKNLSNVREIRQMNQGEYLKKNADLALVIKGKVMEELDDLQKSISQFQLKIDPEQVEEIDRLKKELRQFNLSYKPQRHNPLATSRNKDGDQLIVLTQHERMDNGGWVDSGINIPSVFWKEMVNGLNQEDKEFFEKVEIVDSLEREISKYQTSKKLLEKLDIDLNDPKVFE